MASSANEAIWDSDVELGNKEDENLQNNIKKRSRKKSRNRSTRHRSSLSEMRMSVDDEITKDGTGVSKLDLRKVAAFQSDEEEEEIEMGPVPPTPFE